MTTPGGRRGRLGDVWHLDEVYLRINGKQQYLWRAVDLDGSVLDILMLPRRDDAAARRFFGRVLKGAGYEPRVVITDQLASYTKPCAELLPDVEHRRNKALTIGPRIHINRHANESDECGGSSRRAMRNDSFPASG